MTASALLADLRRHGASIAVDGDNLRLRTQRGRPLPADMIARVRREKAALLTLLSAPVDHDAYEERAAVMEFDGGLPREIADGLARLDTMPPPAGYERARWRAVIDGAARFADQWGAQALALGWRPIELWGLNPAAPGARLDGRGLAFLLTDGDVIAMDDRQAVIRMRQGGEQRYRRWVGDPNSTFPWNLKGDAA